MAHKLGDGFRGDKAKGFSHRVFTEGNHLLAKCHTPVLPGLLGLSFRKFSWPGRLSLLLLQEDELHKCKRDLLKDFSHHNIIARMTSRVQHSRERSTSALPFRGMHLPPCLSSLFSGDMVRYAHSFEGDGDEWSSLPIRFQILPCPAVL